MDKTFRRAVVFLAGLALGAASFGATFGTVVQVRGTVSDIALDERHGSLYIANFTANRIEVMNTADRSFKNSLAVFLPPSSVAVSPDNRFLVVGHDNNFNPPPPNPGGLTIFDLDANTKQEVTLGYPVLSVAFGAGSQALVVTSNGLLTLDPGSARTQPVSVTLAPGVNVGVPCLAVPLATFPGSVIQASTGVSGDGRVIMVLASASGASTGCTVNTTPADPDELFIFRYTIGSTSATLLGLSTSPLFGPRSIAVDQFGHSTVAGWGLLDQTGVLLAEFPAPTGAFNIGAHAWDYSHNRIFSQVPSTGEGTVLNVLDSDNLTVRERIQLPQNLAGRSTFSSDQQTLYVASVSGVTVFPIGNFDSAHRVATLQEDLVFQAGVCVGGVISQTLDIVDLGGGNIDFTLSLPAKTAGVYFSQVSGTTPAKVRIDVDPTVYQNAKGTTTLTLTIQSSAAINLPSPVRLLINTHDVNQHGRIVNVPGKITDMIADPVRNRVYLIRQDKNLVLVYDTKTFQRIATMRTGNTPIGMAITTDQKYLIVGNDNSQIANVFDLDALKPTLPIAFPFGHYPRAIGVSNVGMFAISRTVEQGGQHRVDKINFASRLANTPATLGIYKNVLLTPDGVLTSSPGFNTILMALVDGNTVLYDASADSWVASRQDFPSLGGAFGAINDSLYLVDNHLFDSALVPSVDLESATGKSSGMGVTAGYGLRTTTSSATAAGTLERIDLVGLTAFHGSLTVEAPVTPALLRAPLIGQIGQTISSFSRALAVPADQSSTILLTQSGLTVVEPTFDSPVTIPAVTSVTNSADHGTDVAPGGLVDIAGSALAPQSAVAPGVPLPLTLGDVCVAVNNVSLPLFNVSSTRIMAQLPFTVTGKAPLIVRTSAGISNPFTVNIQNFAPAIFRSGTAGDQTGLATVVRLANNELVDFTNPIHPDETIAIYLTGMAQTSPAALLGDAAPLNPLAIVSTQPTVTLGGTPLDVTFAGLVPGEVGVYQIDAAVPHGIRDAAQTSLIVTQGGASKSLQVRVVNP